jgi:uncharacterized protein
MTFAIRHEIVGPPVSPHGIRIAHLSDLHLWFSGRKLRQVERLIESWKPDVLALTGDYADTWFGRRLAMHWIQKMARIYPVCWVAGNHDRWLGDSFLRQMEALQIAHPIDRRDAWVRAKSGGRFRFTSLGRLPGLPPGSDEAPTIVLLHDPTLIRPEELPRHGNCLLLAGHLHGGQINLWVDRQGRPQPAASFYSRLADRSTIGTAQVIVSRGLGDTLPIRVQSPPEIVIVDFWDAAPCSTG